MNNRDDGSQLVCYCFGYSVADLRQDVRKNGYSRLRENILREKKDGGCRCAQTNPAGR